MVVDGIKSLSGTSGWPSVCIYYFYSLQLKDLYRILRRGVGVLVVTKKENNRKKQTEAPDIEVQ